MVFFSCKRKNLFPFFLLYRIFLYTALFVNYRSAGQMSVLYIFSVLYNVLFCLDLVTMTMLSFQNSLKMEIEHANTPDLTYLHFEEIQIYGAPDDVTRVYCDGMNLDYTVQVHLIMLGFNEEYNSCYSFIWIKKYCIF